MITNEKHFASGLFLSSRCSKKRSNADIKISQYFKVMITNEKHFT